MGLLLPRGLTDLEGTHGPARQRVCSVCVGGILTGSLEGVREVAQTLRIRFVVFGCVSYWLCSDYSVGNAVFYGLSPGDVSAPFQPDSVCLGVLRQCLLTEQARSQSLTSPTFSNGSVLCGGTIRLRISAPWGSST
jgi:hypothetical protein